MVISPRRLTFLVSPIKVCRIKKNASPFDIFSLISFYKTVDSRNQEIRQSDAIIILIRDKIVIYT